ncbi:MAG: transposase, partial [Thioalkalivibrio sp.]
EVRERIEAADADTLLDWSTRILTAERVDDIFR